MWKYCSDNSQLSKQAFQCQSEFSQQQMWYSGTVTNQKTVTTAETENTISDVSFPYIFVVSLYL